MASVSNVVESGIPTVDHGIELEPLSRGTWKLAKFLPIPATPVGTRVIVEMPEGRIEGERIKASVVGGACADWFVVAPDGTGLGDYRGTLQTDDGALIFMHGTGRADLTNGFGAQGVLIGNIHFETGDDRYTWLNTVHAVMRGVVVGDGMAGEATFYDEYFIVR